MLLYVDQMVSRTGGFGGPDFHGYFRIARYLAYLIDGLLGPPWSPLGSLQVDGHLSVPDIGLNLLLDGGWRQRPDVGLSYISDLKELIQWSSVDFGSTDGLGALFGI